MSANGVWTTRLESLGKLPLRTCILIGVALLLAAAFLDWVTGPELAQPSFTWFPSLDVLESRTGGRAHHRAGQRRHLVGPGADHHKPYSNHWIPFWNGFVRTTSFCLVSGLLSEVMERRRLEGRVRQTREDLATQAGITGSISIAWGMGWWWRTPKGSCCT